MEGEINEISSTAGKDKKRLASDETEKTQSQKKVKMDSKASPTFKLKVIPPKEPTNDGTDSKGDHNQPHIDKEKPLTKESGFKVSLNEKKMKVSARATPKDAEIPECGPSNADIDTNEKASINVTKKASTGKSKAKVEPGSETRSEPTTTSLAQIVEVENKDEAQGSPTKSKEDLEMEKMLQKMQFKTDRANILKLLKEAKLNSRHKEIIVVNDSRLADAPLNIGDAPLASTSLGYGFTHSGYVIYSGAQSRAGHSNRAADLDLFLLPEFNSTHHYATIQVRIPAEFLSYRGNIAVRKSALWGTEIYSDDSDVVAVIIHSGHYRPVDAPDPVQKNPDGHSVDQAKLVNSSLGGLNAASKIISKTEISTIIEPVIAKADPFSSSSTTLVPDHDLHVTLRILPKLQQYTGSTRYGLDSKGWGNHDGESIRVECVERVPRGSVNRAVRKSVARKRKDYSQESAGAPAIIIKDDGNGAFKYDRALLIDWPFYLKNEHDYGKFRKEDLQMMKSKPYWQLQLMKFKCILHSQSEKLVLKQLNGQLHLAKSDGKLIYQGDLNSLEWQDEGLVIDNLKIGINCFHWIE
jgi:hypothetical protein